MSNEAKLEVWTEISRELRSVINELSTECSLRKLMDAEVFLEHNELGLACEEIEGVMAELELKPSARACASLGKARRLMGLSAEPQKRVQQ